MDIRIVLFIKRVISHWNSLLRMVVTTTSLSEFKEQLDDFLSYII